MEDATDLSGRARLVLRLTVLAIVLAAVSVAVLSAGTREAPRGMTRPGPLRRPGSSTDLLCDLAAAHATAPPRRERRLAPACSGAPEDSSARTVPIGNDRRRGLVLRANEVFESTIEPKGASVLRFWGATRGLGDELDVRVSVEGAPVWERRLGTHEKWVSGEIRLPEDSRSEIPIRIETQAPLARHRDARFIFGAPRLLDLPQAEDGGAPNIVLYMIDTLRADHTPMYGYPRNTMPRTAELSKNAIVFDRAYSTAARTRPATASALTGLYPGRHHARLGRGIDFKEETLAESLRANGWSTWAFVANGNVFARGFAFDQGFDLFQSIRGKRLDNHARTEEINEHLFPLIREHADEPFFLYVHAIDPHTPYDPPPAFAGRFRDPNYSGPIDASDTHSKVLALQVETEADVEQVRALYDEDILYQDAMFAELLDALQDAQVLDRTLVIVVADHGDEFHEHGGWEHGNRLFEEQIRIPFLVRLPESESPTGRRVAQPVSLADVSPTILGLYGLEIPDPMQGEDRSGLVFGGASRTSPVYAEEVTNIPGGDLRTLIDGPWKLIRRASGDEDDPATEYRLYNLDEDPEEVRDVSAREPGRVEKMRSHLLQRSASLASPLENTSAPVVLDERTKRQLQALGYVVE